MIFHRIEPVGKRIFGCPTRPGFAFSISSVRIFTPFFFYVGSRVSDPIYSVTSRLMCWVSWTLKPFCSKDVYRSPSKGTEVLKDIKSKDNNPGCIFLLRDQVKVNKDRLDIIHTTLIS